MDIKTLYTQITTALAQVGTDITARLSKANNLSDVASVTTARTNLGLGTVAVLSVGTAANNVVQLDSSGRLPAVDGSQLTNVTTSSGGHIEFTSSGTWTCPTGVTTIYVSGCGAGGGGIAFSNAGRWGGGAGRSVIRQKVTVTPGTTYTITIGVGVAGGVGGATSLGSLVSLPGGFAGQGIGNNSFQGMGHSSAFGQGGNIGVTTPVGYGGGAGGTCTSGSAAAAAGAQGFLLIEY